jgi:hypothetical protein
MARRFPRLDVVAGAAKRGVKSAEKNSVTFCRTAFLAAANYHKA